MATNTIAVSTELRRAPTLAASPESAMRTRQRVELARVLIDRVGIEEAVTAIHGFLLSHRTHQVVTVNLDFLTIASRDERFREIINSADLAVADGMPLVWVSHLKGQPLPGRLTGVELVHECCSIAATLGSGVFLLGAAPGVADRAASRLQQRYPGLRVVGTFSPPFRPMTGGEDESLVARIRDAAPDFLFVALGAPRQDLWIFEHRDRIRVPVAIGVGCVLDLYAGTVSRAPSWMQRAGLEWGFRLAQEPTRLWRRYILDDLPMLGRLVLSTAGGRAQSLAVSGAATEGL